MIAMRFSMRPRRATAGGSVGLAGSGGLARSDGLAGSDGLARFGGLAGSGGFTIIEIVMAMFILLFGMTAVLGLLTFGAALSRTALLRTTAASSAEAVVADLEETLFPLVDGEAGEPIEIRERGLHGVVDVIYSATAHANPARPTEYRVDIDMTWKSAGVQREKRFSTILLREVPFGERLRKQFVEGAEPKPVDVKPPTPTAKNDTIDGKSAPAANQSINKSGPQ